jgi:GNAT superfamily N-acetyltransferase
MDIRPAGLADVDRLVASLEQYPAAQHHIRGRWATQERGNGVYLIAHRDGEVVGQTMVLRESKYDEVRAASAPAEINGLDAYVKNQGVGTALIRAAEATAIEWGRPAIGLAVGLDNPGARRLYDRLGYQLLHGLRVLDHWTEQAADGTVVRSHADPCDYLLKTLG